MPIKIEGFFENNLRPRGGGTHHSSAGLPAAPGPCTTPPYPATSPHSATLFVRLRWSRRGAARSRSPGLLNKTSFIIIQAEGEYKLLNWSEDLCWWPPSGTGWRQPDSGVLGRAAASCCRASAAASPPTLLLPAATQFCPEMWSCKLLKHNFLAKFCKLASLIMTVNGWSAERAHCTDWARAGNHLKPVWFLFKFSGKVGCCREPLASLLLRSDLLILINYES